MRPFLRRRLLYSDHHRHVPIHLPWWVPSGAAACGQAEDALGAIPGY